MTVPNKPNGASTPQGPPAGSDWSKVLHRLNNILASIHSSLDLALAHGEEPEARPFLVQAQASVRQGALLVNELRLGGPEAAAQPALGAAAAAEANGGPNGRVGTAQAASLEGSERILVVEDDDSVRMLIRAVLTYRGYAVTEARDGEEGVSRFREKGPFDLVILDQAMPKLDGQAALGELRVMDPGVRALGLSGLPLGCDADSQDPAACGFDARLSKPFDNMELVAMVRQLLDRHIC